jgi:hypothetical protein
MPCRHWKFWGGAVVDDRQVTALTPWKMLNSFGSTRKFEPPNPTDQKAIVVDGRGVVLF